MLTAYATTPRCGPSMKAKGLQRASSAHGERREALGPRPQLDRIGHVVLDRDLLAAGSLVRRERLHQLLGRRAREHAQPHRTRHGVTLQLVEPVTEHRELLGVDARG